MKALILAGGRSTRLHPLTLNKPKCLLKVGEESILEYQLRTLKEINIGDVAVVAGYHLKNIKENIGNQTRYIEVSSNPKFNNFQGLWEIREELNDISERLLILFSDVLLDKEILKECVEDKNDFSLVIEKNKIEETMGILLNKTNSYIIDIGKHIPYEKSHGNFIGVASFSQYGAKKLSETLDLLIEGNESSYYTEAIRYLIKKGTKINFIATNKRPWIEIDFEKDLEKAIKETYPKISLRQTNKGI